MNGGRPAVAIPLADYLFVDGGYAVSDSPSRLSGFPDSEYPATTAPAAFFQSLASNPNVALAANGAVASASTTYSANYPASAVIDGDRKGLSWNAGGGWNDATPDAYPDWVEVAFAGPKSIGEIDVFTLQDTPANPSEPTGAMTFTLSGITHFNVQYWSGSGWVTVPGGSVSGNNKVWRKFTFMPVTTTKIRVLINGSLENYSRVTEIEAYTRSVAYGGNPSAIPGQIEAEHFDEGGQGVAYSDTTSGSSGQDYDQPPPHPLPAFRQPTDVDIYKSAGYSNNHLIVSHAGDWMNYTVEVAASGSYKLNARVTWGGAGGTLGTFHVEMDGVDVTGPIQIPDTNWTMTTVTKQGVQLTAGRHVLRVVADTNAGNGIMGDIDYLKFDRTHTAFNGQALSIPGRIEAEHFDDGAQNVAYFDTTPGTHGQDYTQPPNYPPPPYRLPTDVDIYRHVNYGAGHLIVLQAGDWMKYTTDVAASGAYTLEARVAWGGAGGTPGTFHVEANGVDVTGPMQIPDTNWVFTTIRKPGVQLTAGRHVLRVVADTNAGNNFMGDIDYLRFTGPASGGAGAVLHWKFDEGAGASAADSSGSGHTGTLLGANWGAGRGSPSAVTLDGVDDYVTAGDHASLKMTSQMSVSAWVYPTGVGSNATAGGIIFVREGEYEVARFADGTIRWAFANTSPGWNWVNTNYVAPLNQWTHLSVTYDLGIVKTYANGSLVHTHNGSGTIGDTILGQNDFRVGGRQAISQHFKGTIDEVRVYNRALSPQEASSPVGVGDGTGLTAEYYDNADLTGYRLTRTDANVNFDWGLEAPAPLVGAEDFSVRWTGMIVPRYSEQYTFHTTTDDGVRLWVDGRLLIDKWFDQAPTEWSNPQAQAITLTAGRQYSLRMEYYDRALGAMAKLSWSSASQAKEIVPQSRLYACWKEVGQFVDDFYQGALSRPPGPAESEDWSNQLTQAQGEAQLILEARGLGRALFKSAEYTGRGRTNEQYVEDLYRGYLQRQPDAEGLNHWRGVVESFPDQNTGREVVLVRFEESPEFEEKVRRLCGTSSSASENGGSGYNFSNARLEPSNRTGGGGVDALSRNYNWSLPILSLPGRAGLDLGLSLTYNSLVWTRDSTAVTFDSDRGFPSPGFRLGFPVIQSRFINPQLQQANQPVRYSYLLVTPSGGRVELRQKSGSTNVYESADSSYLELTDYGGGALQIISTDGTRLSFFLTNGEYQCREVMDRNGNYLTVNHDSLGQITNISDTLGRVVSFNYDAFQNLISITQPWKREREGSTPDETPHTWATFGYRDLTLQPSFSNLGVMGTPAGTVIPALSQVGLADGSYYKFKYNDWGQVYKITHYAADSVVGGEPKDTHALSYTLYNLPGSELVPESPQEDCPRFTEQRVWVERGVLGQSAEVKTEYSTWSANQTSCEVTLPDDTPGNSGDDVVHREIYGTGWRRGLTTRSEVWAGGEIKKTTETSWEHDGAEGDASPTNARVTQTTVLDSPNNGRTTRIEYGSLAEFRLPKKVEECDKDCSAVLRTTVNDYDIPNLGEYTSRRIIGLPRFTYLYEGLVGGTNLRSKVEYVYDEPDTTDDMFLAALPPNTAATQHYGAGYGSGFRRRGNANRVRRYEVDQTNGALSGSYVETRAGYNVTGTLAYTKDASGHKSSVSYKDVFFDGIDRNTFAYPTLLTDPDGHVYKTWYAFEMGVVTRTRTPKPDSAAGAADPEVNRYYDQAGRIRKVLNAVNNTHTEWAYSASQTLVETFTTISDESLTDASKKAYAATVYDGAGRVRGKAGDLHVEGMTGRYTGVLVRYDALGRVQSQSNPTEITTSGGVWAPAGDDYNGGQWRWTSQKYDWIGRPILTITADDKTREALYGGCGCAGGQVVTTRDEVGRRQRVTYDSLGRVWKAQVLTSQLKSDPLSHGADADVYSTITNTYNARDQLTLVREQEGVSGAVQDTTTEYDKHGRVWKHHAPGQAAGHATIYEYYPDDAVQRVRDARGVKAVYGYNNRHQVASVTYDLTGVISGQSVEETPDLTFTYDAAGNRTHMFEVGQGQSVEGQVDYTYDVLSRLKTETRKFPGLGGSYQLAYDYTAAGQLKSLTDHTNATTEYHHDRAGRVESVTASGSTYGGATTYASDIEYRAWGAMKSLKYGNNMWHTADYDARLRIKRFEVRGVKPPFPSTAILSEYAYDADGRLRFAGNGGNGTYDRAYSYDDFGRLKEAFTSQQARDYHLNGTIGGNGGAAIPYRQTYQYDVWGNQTRRDNWYWERPDIHLANYSNNRRTDAGWHYDASGNLAASPDVTMTYDAAGRNQRVTNQGQAAPKVITQRYGGDGQVIKRVEEGGGEATETVYYVRSSVLSGAVAVELNAQGVKAKGKVYLGRRLIAEHGEHTSGARWVEWKHEEPVTGKHGVSSPEAYFYADEAGEKDPEGIAFGPPTLMFPAGGISDERGPAVRYGEGVSNGRCTLDGMAIDCAELGHRMDVGQVAAEFLFRDEDGFKHLQSQIHSFGLGLFGVEVPELKPDNERKESHPLFELDWRKLAFSFQPLQRNPTDCEIYANMVDEFARTSKSLDEFVHRVYNEFKRDDDTRFRSVGFKQPFTDEVGPDNSPNQVRHHAGGFFVGYFAGAGAWWSTRTAPSIEPTYSTALKTALYVMNSREATNVHVTDPNTGLPQVVAKYADTESHKADIRLNEVSVRQGFVLGTKMVGKEQVGDMIRKVVCDPPPR